MKMKHRVNIADLPSVLSFGAFPNSLIDKSTNNCIVFTYTICFCFITSKCRTTAGMTLDFKENVLFFQNLATPTRLGSHLLICYGSFVCKQACPNGFR